MSAFGKWIPVKWRKPTEEEREELCGYYETDIKFIADFEMPDDGEEILISQHNGEWVSLVEFCNDEYGIGDANGNDWIEDVDAWMPLPKGYRKDDLK